MLRMSRRPLALVLTSVIAFAGAATADLTTLPTAWSNFTSHGWYPYTIAGVPARDFENDGACIDPTRGSSAFSGGTDLASGGPPYDAVNCNPAAFGGGTCCGTSTTGFWSYFNGGSDTDTGNDYFAVRMRVNGDPRDSTDNCLSNSHWNYLVDSDADGFKEIWVDLWGNQDRIRVLWEDNPSQSVTNEDPAPAPGTVVNEFTACAVATVGVLCGSGGGVRTCVRSHSRVCGVTSSLTDPASCTTTTNATGEWFIDIQVPIAALTDNTGALGPPAIPGNPVFPTFPPQASWFFSTSDASTDPVQKDFVASCTTVNGPCIYSDPTAVSLAYFRAERLGGGVAFEWSTASESGNVGFDLYAERRGAWRKLTGRPVESRRPFSLERVDYRLELPGAAGERFLIEDVDLRGERRRHGPFEIETTYGARRPRARADWAAIRAEHERRAAGRAGARAAAQRGAGPGPVPTRPVVDLLVDRGGIYRLTHEQLAASGFDFAGVPASSLALTLLDRPVPIRVGGPARFGRGSYGEFVGDPATGVYTRTNVYRLAVDPARAARVLLPPGPAAGGARPPADTYSASVLVDENLEWTFSAPGDDPWYRDWVAAFAGHPVVRTYSFAVDRLRAGATTLELELWGMTDWPAGPDHHVLVALNGVPVADRSFDGLARIALEIPVRAGLLVEGVNEITLTLPVDAGVGFEVVAVDRFGARYPRALVAREGELAFALAAPAFAVDGFGDASVLGYQRSGDQVAFLGARPTEPSPLGRRATFRAVPSASRPEFVVAQPTALRAPGLRAAALAPELRRQPARYLVIAHPDFIAALDPLVAARRADGYTVQVADVEAVYGEFGHGRFGPEAIRDYIAFAAAHLGTEMVLLVGGDTYDYLGHGGSGSLSFVPTLYAQTGPIVRRAPTDALYGDLDLDGVPELAVGRFPVHTAAETALLVAKTLAYPSAGHAGSALLVADGAEVGADFAATSEATFALLPTSWSVVRAYVDDLGVAGARAALLSSLDQGVAFAQYAGHSAPDYWSFQTLFTREDAQALANAGRPSVVAQWGCWNTFFVTPEAATLADRLLLAGDRGAVAVLGPAALAASASHRQMSELVARELLENGLALGPALTAARRELAASRPWMIDVVRGVNLLGDPALRIAP
jgi:hypothetical protein